MFKQLSERGAGNMKRRTIIPVKKAYGIQGDKGKGQEKEFSLISRKTGRVLFDGLFPGWYASAGGVLPIGGPA